MAAPIHPMKPIPHAEQGHPFTRAILQTSQMKQSQAVARRLGWGGHIPHLLRQRLLPAVLVQMRKQVDFGAVVLPQRNLSSNSADDDLLVQGCHTALLTPEPPITPSAYWRHTRGFLSPAETKPYSPPCMSLTRTT